MMTEQWTRALLLSSFTIAPQPALQKKKWAQILLPGCSCPRNRMTSKSCFLEWRHEQVWMIVQCELTGPGGRRLGLATQPSCILFLECPAFPPGNTPLWLVAHVLWVELNAFPVLGMVTWLRPDSSEQALLWLYWLVQGWSHGPGWSSETQRSFDGKS